MSRTPPVGNSVQFSDYTQSGHSEIWLWEGTSGGETNDLSITPVVPAEKWRGGTMALRPGKADLQEKTWPIETFFHKIVMVRNRLRTLEQQVNASDLPDDVKVKLQSYVSGCYGSLTSFNVLFADDADRFQGSSGADQDK